MTSYVGMTFYCSFCPESDLPQVVSNFLEGKYEVILESNEISKQILDPAEYDKPATDLGVFLQRNLDTLLTLQHENVELR